MTYICGSSLAWLSSLPWPNGCLHYGYHAFTSTFISVVILFTLGRIVALVTIFTLADTTYRTQRRGWGSPHPRLG
jgi:hypothetical protein